MVAEKAQGLLPDFVTAAQELAELGADGITTNCGFLSLYQRELAAAGAGCDLEPDAGAPDPEHAASRQAGWIITVSAASLTREHLIAIGLDSALPVVGTEGRRECIAMLPALASPMSFARGTGGRGQ